jgi:hypothetical protein
MKIPVKNCITQQRSFVASLMYDHMAEEGMQMKSFVIFLRRLLLQLSYVAAPYQQKILQPLRWGPKTDQDIQERLNSSSRAFFM